MEQEMVERIESAAALLERMLTQMEERIAIVSDQSGNVDKISATIEQTRREEELTAKLTAMEKELAELKAAAEPNGTIRKTMSSSTSELLAKKGIGDGSIGAQALDAALAGLSLEQRIAVKTQLLRTGAVA